MKDYYEIEAQFCKGWARSLSFGKRYTLAEARKCLKRWRAYPESIVLAYRIVRVPCATRQVVEMVCKPTVTK
jgi:hypothetical protein